MYENFSEPARDVIKGANREAQHCNHEYVGSEHILLALVTPPYDTPAIMVLRALGIDPAMVKFRVKQLIQTGPDQVTMGRLPMTPSAKKVLEYAGEEARALHHSLVGTDHILLGLLCVDSVAAQVLKDLGLTLEAARGATIPLSQVLDHNNGTEEVGPAIEPEAPPVEPDNKIIFVASSGITDVAVSKHEEKVSKRIEAFPDWNISASSSTTTPMRESGVHILTTVILKRPARR